MFRAVIFDMDGVIIDSEPMHEQVNFEIFAQYNITISRQEYRERFIGSSNPEMWEYLKAHFNLTRSIEDFIAMQVEQNVAHVSREAIAPIDGIPQLLDMLRQETLLLGLASSSPMVLIEAVLKKFNFYNRFSAIVSGEELKRSKPDPQIFQKTASLLHLDPEDCLVIEDSMRGVEAAKAAGMKCIGYVNPNSGNQNLTKADRVIKDFNLLDRPMLLDVFINY